MYRPILLHILTNCSPSIRKALKEDGKYFFTNDYKWDKENKHPIKTGKENTSQNLYDIYTPDKHISINVCAVVGKNGDGKSSLVEVLLRILNNFAFTLGFNTNPWTLYPVDGLYASFYYELNDDVFCISVEGHAVGWSKNGQNIIEDINPAWSDEEKKQYLINNCSPFLFYTIVNNYSLFAYKDNLFENETEQHISWIQSLYHKNDYYQTPVVVMPMRKNGNIDIKREIELSKQRLLSIYIYAADKEQQRQVNDGKIAVNYRFKLESESKLINNSIISYFSNISNNRLNWNTVDSVINGEYTDNRGINNLVSNFCDFFEWFKDKVNANSTLFQLLYDKEIIRDNHNNPTDWHHYLDFFAEWTENNYIDVGRFARVKDDIMRFSKSFIARMNYSEVYRMLLIIRIWEHFKKAFPKLFNVTLNEAIENRQLPINAARLYAVYKIIQITNTYSPYNDRSYLKDNTYETAINKYNNILSFKVLDIDIDTIITTHDYTTLKLHQTLNFIARKENQHTTQRSSIYPSDNSEVTVSFPELKRYIGMEKKLRDIMELLPPPVFIGDIRVSEGNNEFDLSDLSSGELQMLCNVGSTIYQLRNIDDELTEPNMINYRYVNIVLEEVELYFHPDFQRKFTAYLLSQIKMSQLENIDGINICFITHSPFVLSDVITSNTLYLKQGSPYSHVGNKESFGANVYDLLNDHFFMDEFIGAYASEEIDKWIESVNTLYDRYIKVSSRRKNRKTNEEGDNINSQLPTRTMSKIIKDAKDLIPKISLVGDEFIRQDLMEKLDYITNSNDKRRLQAEYDAAIEEAIRIKQKIDLL